MEQTKICSKCGRELPLERFGRNPKTADGHQNICLECFGASLKGRKKKRKPKTEEAPDQEETVVVAEGTYHPSTDEAVYVPVKKALKAGTKKKGKTKAVKKATAAAVSMTYLESAAIDLLKGFSDKELANELRARGWDVLCTKTTVIEI